MSALASLLQQGRFADALPELQRMHQAQPADAKAAMQLFMALMRLERPDDAEQVLSSAVEAGARHPSLNYNLALLRAHLGRLDDALALLDDPPAESPDAVALRGVLLQQLGRPQDAREALTRVTSMTPDDARAFLNLGVHLSEHAPPGEAIDAYRRAVALSPDLPDAHLGLAAALKADGQVDASEDTLKALLLKKPDHAEALASLGVCQLTRDAFADAEASFARALHFQPGNQNALAGLALAWSALEKQAEYDWLMDYANLLRVANVPVPQGYADLDGFNRALVDEVLADPSLLRDPHGRTTRQGRQSADLRLHGGPAVSALIDAVSSAFETYRAGIPEALRQGGHPVVRRAPQRWHMSIWSTVLEAGGHQLPHIHPSGWLSGVYYAQTDLGEGEDAGCIEFGAPPQELGAQWEGRCLIARHRPAAGEIILFPSYFYHRTVPHAGGPPRVSIAFDCMPA